MTSSNSRQRGEKRRSSRRARSIHTAVILRCSPFFTASLEGWATSARGHPSRRAQERAPQDDGGVYRLQLLPKRVVDDPLQRRLDAGPLGRRILQKNEEHVVGRIDHEIGAAGAIPFDLADRARRRRHRLAGIGADAKTVTEAETVAGKIEM